MELKEYQKRVLEETQLFLQTLGDERRKGNVKYARLEAWEASGKSPTAYHQRLTGDGRDLPHFCLKVPTGGGKTLLATQVLAQAYKHLLPERQGVGLVLWVVPSDQIYRDTLKALRDGGHPYRQSLEFALSRRVQVWEKEQMVRLTPAQLRADLNILLIKLQGANRKDKSYLKFFRDSGGNIIQHFPPEDDLTAQADLKRRVPNLDRVTYKDEEGNEVETPLIATSIGNLVRLCEPIVIVDEGQKATSALARETLEGFNPTLMVELSATPPQGANILCRVTGDALLKEEMIKMPIQLVASKTLAWQTVLANAKAKRDQLAAAAVNYYKSGGRIIRPIVVVQVERTGKDQRTGNAIHSEDVREYLTQRLDVPSVGVRVKTSDMNEIADDDLMNDECPVEWIITKAALQEGWDCPFAYILVSLNKTRGLTAMTQLVGRVLRQPFVRKVPEDFQALNESYVFCLHSESGEVVEAIRKSLRNEGYEGEAVSIVDRSDSETAPIAFRMAKIRPEILKRYGKPFVGSIALPRFCVRVGEGNDSRTEPLDYFSHLLRTVDVSAFPYENAAHWDMTAALADAKQRVYRVGLDDGLMNQPVDSQDEAILATETNTQTVGWLVASLNIDWFSSKQLYRIANSLCERLPDFGGPLSPVRFYLLDRISAFIQERTDTQTEAAFKTLYDEGRLAFTTENRRTVFEIPPEVRRNQIRALVRSDNAPIVRNLFDFQPDEDNRYEKDVARYFDESEDTFWWKRNVVAREEFSIQGYRRNAIYPDFIVQLVFDDDGKRKPRVLIVESKGHQLKGSHDTEYKRKVADYFTLLGKAVPWQEIEGGVPPHSFHMEILDQGDYGDMGWRDPLSKMLKGYEPVTNFVVK